MQAKETLFERRQRRVRYAIRTKGNGRARLSVFRSEKHIYAQIIDDTKGVTLVSASSVDKDLKAKIGKLSGIESAKLVGEAIAERAKKAKIEQVAFDRGGYIYHGRVKVLADSARAGGLQF